MMERLRRGGTLDAAPYAANGRVVRYVLSTPAVGRDQHTVAADAWVLTNYLKNPVFLWAHDDTLPPIGRMVEIGTFSDQLKGNVEYADRDVNPFADTVYRLVRGGYLNAVSASWRPLEWSYARDKDRPGGIDFTKVDLLEVSQVPLPALPAALAEARSRGIDTLPLYHWAERALDLGGGVLPRTELEELRRSAKMPHYETDGAARRRAIARELRACAHADLSPGARAQGRLMTQKEMDAVGYTNALWAPHEWGREYDTTTLSGLGIHPGKDPGVHDPGTPEGAAALSKFVDDAVLGLRPDVEKVARHLARAAGRHRTLGEQHEAIAADVDGLDDHHARLQERLTDLGVGNDREVARAMRGIERSREKLRAHTADAGETHAALGDFIDAARRALRDG